MDPFGLFDGAEPVLGPVPASASSGGLWISAADGWHDLGGVDVDGDGVVDTGTWETDAGTAVFTDLDADGVADVCQQIRADGTFATLTFDGVRWRLIDSGDLS